MVSPGLRNTLYGVLLAVPALFLGCDSETGPEREGESDATRRLALAPLVTANFQDGTNGYAGTTDTRLVQDSPATSYGSSSTLGIDGDDPHGTGRDSVALFRWALSGIPAGSVVQAARISVRVTDSSASAYALYSLTRSWSESTATWQRARTGVSWQRAGASGPLDRGSQSLGSIAGSRRGTFTIELNAAGVAAIQGWLDDPSQNFGVILAGANERDGLDLASSESTTVSYRPMLSIDYSPPAAPGDTSQGGSGGTGGVETGGTASGGVETGGTASGGVETGGTASGGTEAGGTASGGVETGGTASGGTEAGGAAGSDASGGAGPTAMVFAAGDIGDCNSSADLETSLLLDASPDPILALGDLAYPSGSIANFSNCFDPVWGRHKSRIRPVPGNHEYMQSGASGYFAYFGAAAGEVGRGYYSFDLGEWHIVALNSNCSQVSCAAGSAQEQWLRRDLAANPRACTLAFWHHPRFSSGMHGNNTAVTPLWQALEDAGVEIVLSGHDHGYERFLPQDAGGALASTGIIQFVIGTGGTSLGTFGAAKPNSVIRSVSANGVMSLALRPGGFDFQFLPIAGRTFSDQGSGSCH